MSGQAGAVLRAEWFVLELRHGVRVNVAVTEDSGPETHFAEANRPYERWAAACAGPLDELLRELRTREGLPLVPMAQGVEPETRRDARAAPPPEGMARRVHLRIDGFPIEELSLSLSLQRPLQAGEQETLTSRVRDLLTTIEPIARPPRLPAPTPPVLPSSPVPAPRGLFATLRGAAPAPPRLTLEARLRPMALSATELGEVRFTLSLRNESGSPACLYVDAARLAILSGWGGPSWTLEAVAAGYRPERTRLEELRAGDGPPGIPPSGRAFASARCELRPGETVERQLVACWVPRARIPEEGRREWGDGALAENAAVLVLERSRADVERALVQRPDFPRGEVVLLAPERGLLQLTWGYRQQSWAGFAPEQSWALEAPPCTLLIQ